MSFTYYLSSTNATTAALARVRLEIGDTVEGAGVLPDGGNLTDEEITVYLTDHADQKLPAAGAKGKVILLFGKQKTEIALTPAGDNKLAGQGTYASLPAMKAIVAITFPDGRTEQARFTPLMPRPLPAGAAAHQGQHGH